MVLKPKEAVLSLNGRTASQEAAKAQSKTGFRKAWMGLPGAIMGYWALPSKKAYAGTAHKILLVDKK